MGHIRVKTTYEVEAAWGDTKIEELYCHHYCSCDSIVFYDEKGQVQPMVFNSWSSDNNDLWDAMNRLWHPFKDKWFGKLKEGVETYHKGPWEKQDIELL